MYSAIHIVCSVFDRHIVRLRAGIVVTLCQC